MIIVITLIYIGCVTLAFRVIKIPVRPGTVATAVVVGVVLLGGIVINWQMAAPLTDQMFLNRGVVQIVPDVREFITKVHVKPDQRVKKGDVLFEIDPRSSQYAVDQSTAELKAARQTVSQLEAGVHAAEAGVKVSAAQTASAKAELGAAHELAKVTPGAIAKVRVEQQEQMYAAAQADEKRTQAAKKEAEFALTAARNSVEVVAAELKSATFYLGQCKWRAPADGQVINLQVREGTIAARWRFQAIGTFMEDDTVIAAIYPQNLLKNVKPGNTVEIAFKSTPGQVVSGKVDAIVKYTGEGQLAPSGNLPEASSIGAKGYLAVRIRLDDDKIAQKLPLGAAGTVAIYTDVGKPFQIITTITIRIKGWMNFLPR